MIKVPYNESSLDVIVEQVKLCKANLKNIEEIVMYDKGRELRDEIKRKLSMCHSLLAIGGDSRQFACLYREVGLTNETPQVSEHALPVSTLTSLYEQDHPFEELVFYPVTLISKKSFSLVSVDDLFSSDPDKIFIFKKFGECGIRIETYQGVEIDVSKWSIDDHWDLVDKTPEIKEVKDEVFSQIGGHEETSWFGLGHVSRKMIIEEHDISIAAVNNVAFVLYMYFKESPPQSNGVFLDAMYHASNMGGFDPEECKELEINILRNQGLVLAVYDVMDFSGPDA